MSFTSLEFLLFVAVTVILYYLVPKKIQWIVLLVSSYVFYVWGGFKLLFFLLFTTLTTFGTALWLDEIKNRISDKKVKKKKKRLALIIGLVLNFGMLGALKYTGFMVDNINAVFGADISFGAFALPLGISFYTFQSMGYLIDVYWEKYPAEKNPARFALFVSFFPQLLQGPIGRHDRLAHQLYEAHSFSMINLQHGMQRMLWGFFKKLVLADRAGVIVNEVFNNYTQYEGITVILGILMYSIQLYGDFSGGMDVVLGVAEIFGIRLDENFKRPYFAISITDFWHRWHITLGTWMKDYIFYPMSLSKGMNKLGKKCKKLFGKQTGRVIPVAFANIVVFFVVGVWHGAAWKYIIYGLYNGVLIALANLLAPVNGKALKVCHINEKSGGWHIFRILRTFFLVNVSWYFDIAVTLTASWAMMAATVRGFTLKTLTDGSLLNLGLDKLDFCILGFGCVILFAVSFLQEKGLDIREFIDRRCFAVRWAVYLFIIFALPMLGYIIAKGGGFIYAQF